MSELACNIVIYRPDPETLAAKFNYWHLEALLHQADTLITRCLADFEDYSSLDFAWNQFQTDLETQEKKLGRYSQTPERDVFDRSGSAPGEMEGMSDQSLVTQEESEILTLVETVEADQERSGPAEAAPLKTSLDFRVEEVQRKKELSAPGRPFALNERRDLALKRLCRDYEEAVDRACVAQQGLRKLYDHVGASAPLPTEAETLGTSITALSTWIRNSLEWLSGYHLREQSFTRVVSVRSLLNRNAWVLLKHSRESYSVKLQLPADLFRGHDNCHLRGVAAALVGEVGTVPWSMMLRLPDEAVYERNGQSVELDQSDRTSCLLGRVENHRSARPPELCGTATLRNASPVGRSNLGGLWSLEIVKPVGATSESFGHLEDVILEISAVGVPRR